MVATRGPITYPPVGQCIYCDKSDAELSDEHILAEGLGGTLILPEASCPDCEKKTCWIETVCLRHTYGPVRYRRRFPRKKAKRKTLPTSLPLEIEYWDGTRVVEHVPLEKYPAPFVGYIFKLPGIFRGVEPAEAIYCEPVYVIPDEDLNNFRNRRLIMSIRPEVKLNPIVFARMLAKIAHSFAIAILGINGFQPMLKSLIVEEDLPMASYLVGGGPGFGEPDIGNGIFYTLNCGSRKYNGIDYVVVSIKLFATELPRYEVVVGKVTAATSRVPTYPSSKIWQE
jgi:hypothetical protein